jgi:hypothetical protein
VTRLVIVAALALFCVAGAYVVVDAAYDQSVAALAVVPVEPPMNRLFGETK